MNKLLESYIPTAEVIASSIGSCCEVVLHDLTQPESSVVYVANSQVTNRQVGQSFDHLVRQVLLNKNFRNDYVANYMFTTPDNRTIKSSSALIRNEADEVVGMLCINIDITAMQEVSRLLSGFVLSDPAVPAEQGEKDADPNVASIIDELILKIIGNTDVKNLTRRRSVEIVRFMDEKGIFLVRGSMEKVANLMGVSKVTIYSYLDEAKGKTAARKSSS